MTQFRRITGMLFALLLALTFVPAAAEEETTDPLDDLSQFEGIEFAVSRSWTIDFMAMMEITPEDDAADPFADMEGVWFVTAIVAEFDSDDNADAMYDYFAELEDEELLADLDDPEAEINRDELDDIGDQAQAFTIVTSGEDFGGNIRYSFAQKDNYVFFAFAVSTNEDSEAVSDDLLAAMADEDDHSGLGDYDPEATEELDDPEPTMMVHSDGLWEFFPDNDDELFDSLVHGGDEVLYPEQESEEDEG
jgi:hypothetical protein